MNGMADGVPLGKLIQGARGRRRLSQDQLARLLHVSRKTVDNWENLRTTPSKATVAAIEGLFGDDLYGEAEPDPKVAEVLAIIESMEPGEKRDLWLEAAQRISNGKHGREPARPERAG